jgi:hypothetical protein
MPAITSGNVAQAIVKLVAADALPALVSNLVMGNLVNRDYEPVLAQAGDTVNVAIAPSLVANDIMETGSVQTQNPNLGNAQIVLNKHKEATFKIPDVTKVLAVPDLLAVYMKPAVVAIAEVIEADLLSLYPGVITSLGAAGTPVTEAVIDAAETQLFTNKVPAQEPKFLIVDAATYGQLRQLPRFSEFQTAGEAGIQALLTGTIGKIKDFFVLRSQNIIKTGSSPINTHNLAFCKDAIGLVMRRLPKPMAGTGAIAEYGELGGFGVRVTMSYDPNTLAQQFTVDVLYGCAILRNQFGVHINS